MQTRRSFISMLTTTVAACAVAPESLAKVTQPSLEPIIPPDDWYRDIRIDRYYITDFPNRISVGDNGVNTIIILVNSLRYAEQCRELDDAVANMCRYANGGCLHVTEYVGDYRHYEDIPVTDRWIRKFYEIHRDDDFIDLRRQYLEAINEARIKNGQDPIDIERGVESFRGRMASYTPISWMFGGFEDGMYRYPDEQLS